MMHFRHSLLALALTACGACGTGRAQMPPPPPPAAAVPPAEVLATAPQLNAAQQAEVPRILIQRRDADEQIHQKARAEMEAVHGRERAEHEKAETQASDALRKLLGDDGYRRFAEWQLMHRGPQGFGPQGMGPHGFGSHGAPPHGRPGNPPNGTAPPPPVQPGAAPPDQDDE